jgi:hypothetical protein
MCPSMVRGFTLLCILSLFAISPGCSDEAECPMCPLNEVQEVSVTREFGPYYLGLISGDGEFGANQGPYVTFEAYSYLKGEDSLICHVSMTAVEYPGGSNITVANTGVDTCVFVTPDGWEITSVPLAPCSAEYVSNQLGWHEVSCDYWSFYYVGDTRGNDICDPPGNCTRFYFYFHETIEMQRPWIYGHSKMHGN